MTEPSPDSGANHLRGLTREHRRSNGMVYTPHPLAEFVLDQALGPAGVPDGPVLDPACGAGVFLSAVISRLARAVAQLGVDIQREGRRTFLRQVKDNVWGVDVDPVAVRLARVELRALIDKLSPGPLPADFLDRNVVVGDYLHDELATLVDVRPRLIVGNPPYVSTNRITPEDKDAYRARFTTAFGRIDLYTLFMEQSVRVLGAEGTWAFITPDKYLTSQSARPIRRLLSTTGAVRSVTQFDSHRIFSDAATIPCVTVWQAGSPADTSLTVSRVALKDDEQRVPQITETRAVDRARLLSERWMFQRPGNESLARRLSAGHPRLGDVTRRISAGLTTGYNPAFVLDAATASELEPELVHPSIRGRDVLAHQIRDRGEHLLVPYVWGSGGARELIDLDEFPKTRRWLDQHRGRLEARHCVRVWGKRWWDLHDPVGEPLHKTPKVLVPDLARSNRFAADVGRFVPQHSAYYLIPTTLPVDLLAALLNSPAVEFLVRSRAPVAKDGFSRYRQQFLRDLPVPAVPPALEVRIRDAVADQRYEDVDVLTSELFGADPEEIARALRLLPVNHSVNH